MQPAPAVLRVAVLGRRLLESLHLTDGRELKVIDRGRIWAYRGSPVYGRNTTWVPLTHLEGVSWDVNPASPAILLENLKLPGGGLQYAFLRDNPVVESYSRFFAGVPGVKAPAVS